MVQKLHRAEHGALIFDSDCPGRPRPGLAVSGDPQEGRTASLLIIAGGMGAGKSSVLAEASDILALRHIVHAAIDVDALGLALLPEGCSADSAMYANLRSICANYAALGIDRFLLARAVESMTELGICRQAVAATQTVVCRLAAGLAVMEQRVRARETGIRSDEFVARVATLNTILDRAALEDFGVVNEGRLLNDVALEVLTRAGWLKC